MVCSVFLVSYDGRLDGTQLFTVTIGAVMNSLHVHHFLFSSGICWMPLMAKLCMTHRRRGTGLSVSVQGRTLHSHLLDRDLHTDTEI